LSHVAGSALLSLPQRGCPAQPPAREDVPLRTTGPTIRGGP